MTLNRLPVVTVIFMVIAALAVTVVIAIGLDRLWSLIGGFFAVGVILVALSAVGVTLYTRMSASRAKREKLRYDFLQAMAAKGALPNDGSFIPLHAQIAVPQAPQAQSISQIIFNPNALRESAVNLLLFSMRQCGPDQNRIASGPECANAGVNGYTPRTWSKIVNEYLMPRYGVATQRGAIDNGGGTFVPAEIGTVEALYHKVLMDSAVDDLPGVTR